MTNGNDPEVSAIVVTWNGRTFLQRSLPALLAQEGVRLDAILIDNCSTDGTAAWVARAYPAVRVKVLETNRGFAQANNLGFQMARAPLIATLNNDAVPDPTWLASLVAAARSHPEAGMFASRIVFAHAPDTINSAGIATNMLGIAWDRHSGRHSGDDQDAEVFGPSAGAALYRRELLEATGGFDPAYFAYLEDVDLAWRAQWLGWRGRYVAAARVLHTHSATGIEDSAFKTYHLGRNKLVTVLKNYPAAPLLRYLPLMLAYDLASLPVTIWRQRSLAAVRGRLVALASLGSIWRRRRAVMAARRARWADIRARLEPVEPPWAIWRRQRKLRAILGHR